MENDLLSQSIQVLKLEAGVDWLTMTVKDQKQRRLLFDRYQSFRRATAGTKSREKKFSWHGYAGLQTAGCRWGVRPDSDILIISGATAKAYWKLFARLAENVTRLDLAVTAVVYPPIRGLTSIYYENLDHRDLKWNEIRSEGGGNTLYVGKRISGQMGRIYDKGIESGLSPISGSIWRYEIEYKDEYPGKILNRLLCETCPRLGIAPLVISHTFNWFETRNIPPIFKASGSGVIESHVQVIDKDDERTLMWFRTQVSPAVQRLIGHRRTDVLEALGLAEADPSKYAPSI